METLFILLKNYQSPWEAFFVGGMTALLFYAIFGISGVIRNAKKKNKKDFDEVSKKETQDNNKSDWD